MKNNNRKIKEKKKDTVDIDMKYLIEVK